MYKRQGQWGDHAKVIDLAAMEERPVTRDDAVLEGAVQLQFVALREDEGSDPQAIYQVTGPDGETVYGGFYYGLGLDVPPSQAPVFTYGYIEHIALADGQLVLSSAFSAGLSADQMCIRDSHQIDDELLCIKGKSSLQAIF